MERPRPTRETADDVIRTWLNHSLFLFGSKEEDQDIRWVRVPFLGKTETREDGYQVENGQVATEPRPDRPRPIPRTGPLHKQTNFSVNSVDDVINSLCW